MRVRLATAIVLLLAPAAPGRGAAAERDEPAIPPVLTLERALAIFRTRGFDLLIAEAHVGQAAGDARAAAAVPNPSVSGGVSHSWFDNGHFDTHTGWSVGMGDSNAIEDVLSGKRGLRVRTAQAALAAARMQQADARRTLELQVKLQYFETLLATAMLELASEVATAADGTFQLTQRRYTAGAVSEIDVAKTETAKLEAEQAADRAAQALREAKVALVFLLGSRAENAAFAVDVAQLRYTTPRALAGATAASLVERALSTRPDLQAQARQRERAAAARALARRQRFPDIATDLQYQEQGASSNANAITPPTLTLSLAATLPLFYQQQGEILRADADLRAQEVLVEKARAQVVADVETAFAAYETSRRLVERMEGRLLERARRARDLVRLQYEKGATSLLEYLDAQRSYIAASSERLQDLAGYWSAVFQLEAAVALELRP
jgi:cobalt-zinc-cadmium efflux system outer membrane protein